MEWWNTITRHVCNVSLYILWLLLQKQKQKSSEDKTVKEFSIKDKVDGVVEDGSVELTEEDKKVIMIGLVQ